MTHNVTHFTPRHCAAAFFLPWRTTMTEFSLEMIRGRMIRNVARHRMTYVRVQPDVMSNHLINGELIAVGRRHIHVSNSQSLDGVTVFCPSAVVELI
jgi:hypothetical protein